LKAKLEETRDLLHGLLTRSGRPSAALARAARLVEEMLEEWQEWDSDDVATLPFCFPDDEFPTA
jgi:hypothetical protein